MVNKNIYFKNGELLKNTKTLVDYDGQFNTTGQTPATLYQALATGGDDIAYVCPTGYQVSDLTVIFSTGTLPANVSLAILRDGVLFANIESYILSGAQMMSYNTLEINGLKIKEGDTVYVKSNDTTTAITVQGNVINISNLLSHELGALITTGTDTIFTATSPVSNGSLYLCNPFPGVPVQVTAHIVPFGGSAGTTNTIFNGMWFSLGMTMVKENIQLGVGDFIVVTTGIHASFFGTEQI